MMQSVVEARSLTKRYGTRLAVDRVSFQVQPGEVFGLLGPNGSGKSTILRILTGYLTPSSGSVRIGRFDVLDDARSARACVGYVPEDVPLYPHMRVDEILRFMGRLRGLHGKALEFSLDSACDQLALREVRRLLIGKLSRGYRQRVANAQAILHRPLLLVLDEPTNGLDPRQIIELRGLVQSLATTCSVLVTSHVLSEVERMADRVAILMDGRLLKVHSLQHMAKSHLRWLRLQVRTSASATLSALLAAIPGVALVEADGGTGGLSQLRVQITDAQAEHRIMEALSAARIDPHELTDGASELEQLFLELTSSADASVPTRP